MLYETTTDMDTGRLFFNHRIDCFPVALCPAAGGANYAYQNDSGNG